MTHATRKYLFRLSAAWLVLALTSCAHADGPSRGLERLAWSSAYDAVRAPRARSVVLVVNNRCAEPIAIHVLRAGAKAERIGHVGGRRSGLFDVTNVAPVGATVRFAGDRHGIVAFVSDEIRIRRPGSILVELEPEDPARNDASCDAPTRVAPRATGG